MNEKSPNSASNGAVTVAEIAAVVGGRVVGDANRPIRGANALREAGEQDVSFYQGRVNLPAARATGAGAIVAREALEDHAASFIVVESPRAAFAAILREFFAEPSPAPGIHESADIGGDAVLGAGVSIGAFVSVGAGSRIGARTSLAPGVIIGPDCSIGDDVVLHANVSVRRATEIGDRVIIHDGTVVGSDGFGYVQNDGRNEKVPQLGRVVIEGDVEIGACCAIDRAAFGETRIRRGAKIDNLVQVAHNVEIGEDSIVIAQVGISGSSTIGSRCMIGGQAGLVGHIEIADETMIGARSGVARSIERKGVYSGSPAIDHGLALRAMAAYPKLPELLEELASLRRQVDELRERLENS